MSERRQQEAALLDRCRRGDEAAWATLYRTYAPRVALFLRGALGRQDVDDVVQRVFLELLSSLERFRGEAGIATWLQRIAVHVGHKEARGRWRQRRKAEAFAAEATEVGGDGVVARVAARERLAQVAEALGTLDWRFRTVWVMREVQGMTVEEVAAALDTRPETVRTRHHRAKRRLMAALRRIERRSPRGERVGGLQGHQEVPS